MIDRVRVTSCEILYAFWTLVVAMMDGAIALSMTVEWQVKVYRLRLPANRDGRNIHPSSGILHDSDLPPEISVLRIQTKKVLWRRVLLRL